MMGKTPDQRPESAAIVSQTLTEILNDLSS